MTDCLLVTTTVDSREAADRLAAALVSERLAACAQVSGPLASTYRWRGAVQHSTEWQCQLKTTARHVAAIEHAFARLHPYDLPELTIAPISGSAAYLRWIAEATGAEDRS
ncbi:MAG: divalent-cation tolerance protein CutA [Gemmatimonadales bacterium]|nr:divalent-cation tolerance protein CutA [Gemmatimonadales bacterium]